MSRRELADEVNRYLLDTMGEVFDLDRHQVARYERGEVRWPRAAYRSALRAVLGATNDAELGFTPRSHRGTRDDVADDDQSSEGWHPADVVTAVDEMTRQDMALTRRQALASASAVIAGSALTEPLQRWLMPTRLVAGGRAAFTDEELVGWQGIAAQLRGWSMEPFGTIGRKAALAQLNELTDRLRDAPEGSNTRRAFLVGAELAEISASMSWDAGLHQAAQRYYKLAVQLAKVAGDETFAAVSLAALARQSYDLGRPDDGLELVQLAQYGTRKSASPLLRSLLATREAWSYAQSGRTRYFQRAVGLAEDHFTERRPSDSERWITGLDEAELCGVIGARYRDLSRHDPKQGRKAQDYINRALALRDPNRHRNRLFDLIGLARSHLITREPDRACDLIDEALPLASDWAPGRVGAKLRDFYSESASYSNHPRVRETRDALRQLVTV